MLRAVVLFCAVVALTKAETTEVSQCTANPGSLPINTYIEGCITPPCLLPQEQDAIINIIFKAPRVMHDMRTLATAYLPSLIGNIPVPYPLGENALTCNFLSNTYCPVVEGEVIQYTLRMYIETIFPEGTQVPIEFRIVDENSNPVMCIRLVIRIIPPVDSRFGAKNATVIVDEMH